MANENKAEQQMLWDAALTELGRRLRRELEPNQDTPDRMRELLAQLEESAPHKNTE
jgi:hypothetical protein